jgi:TRAP-type C4-dicarboxylate transport system permease small subunit
MGGWGMIASATFLILMVVMVVASVIYRMCGHVIVGSYELTELFTVVAVAFALGYATLEKRDVIIDILIPKIPQRTRTILEAVMSLISLGTWAVIVWAGIGFMIQTWLTEDTPMLEVPYLPFRFVWVFGLLFLCLVYLLGFFTAWRKAVKK